MMEQLRRNMPLILWILVFAFLATIVFSWGMGGFREKQKKGVVGEICGKEITYDAYEQMVQRQISAKYEQSGTEPDPQAVRDMRNQVWDNLVRDILFEKEAKRQRIQVTDAEVVDIVRNNPPPFVQQSEYFQTDGNFDISKYQAFLQNPANHQQVIILEQSYRQSLMQRKLLQKVLGTIEVSDYEMRFLFEEKNISGKAKYLLFAADSMKFDSSIATSAEIEKYYNEHKKDYLEPEERQIIFTEFKNITSHEDSEAVEQLTAEIKEQLDKGADFEALAVEHSEHHTAVDSGKLDWIPRKQLETESDSAVWVTKPGHYCGPVINRFGVHFYQVEDRKKVEGEIKSKLRIIQLKYMPSADTKDIVQNRAANFAEEIKKGDFGEIAQAYNQTMDTSGFFTQEGEFIPKAGKIPSAVSFSFANKVGTTSEIYPLRNGWMVFKILSLNPEHYKSLDEVRSEIRDKVYREKQLAAAKEKCLEFYNGLSDKTRWDKVAMEKGLTVGTTEIDFKFTDFVKGIGRDANFTSVLLRANVEELLGPIQGESGSYLVELIEKTAYDSTEFERGKSEHLPELMQKKQEVVYEQWYNDLKAKSKIKDYRYLYYRDL